jgi:hypothetical protein
MHINGQWTELARYAHRKRGAQIAAIAHSHEEKLMSTSKYLTLAVSAGLCLAALGNNATAQVAVSIGVEPACPYGYYDYAPYSCSPYGYYGPEWFIGGVFRGAGPWLHGDSHFRGHVNNQYDAQRGYRGPLPNRGEKPAAGNRTDHVANFKGNEVRDGHGHVSNERP